MPRRGWLRWPGTLDALWAMIKAGAAQEHEISLLNSYDVVFSFIGKMGPRKVMDTMLANWLIVQISLLSGQIWFYHPTKDFMVYYKDALDSAKIAAISCTAIFLGNWRCHTFLCRDNHYFSLFGSSYQGMMLCLGNLKHQLQRKLATV